MKEYYDIIGRKSKEPIKEKIFVFMSMCFWMVCLFVCVLIALYFGVSSGKIGNALVAFFSLLLLGIVIIPAMAIAEGNVVAICICAFFGVYLLVLIVLFRTKDKPTKRERIRNLELELLKVEFEKNYPDAKKLKDQYKEVWEGHNKKKKVVNDALKSTSKEKINRTYIAGEISESEWKSQISAYEVCEYNAANQSFFDGVTEEISENIKSRLQEYINEFENKKPGSFQNRV